jgi:hypothetical protein
MKPSSILHPFLFGLFLVVNFVSGNVGEADYVDAILVATMILAMVFAILTICQLVLKDIHRSGMIVSGLLVFIFSPYQVLLTMRSWLSHLNGEAVQLNPLAVYAALIFAIAFYVYFFAKKAQGAQQLTPILNVMAACLVGIPLSTIAIEKISQRIDWPSIHNQHQAELLASNITVTPRLPDIYYIIMDRYAGPETLKTIYNFDNKHFLDYLEAKGFYVASRSAGNYPSTAQSLASSLNLQYLTYLGKFMDPESTSWIPIHRLLEDHKVRSFLKSKGYQYIHLGSWWEPTRKNKLADENVYFTPLPEMFYVLYGSTVFQPVSAALGVLDLRYEHWRGNRRQFEDLTGRVGAEGPKFVLAHFLLPHDPYVFSRDGDYLRLHQVNNQPTELNYINQLVYTNRMLQKTIDKLISTSKQPPIIILQADEGPYPRRYDHDTQNFDWRKATNAELNQKMQILNSFYLPGVDSRALYPTISPVNAFRLVFNLYFKTNLPLLPDESFVFEQRRRPYSLLNVTTKLHNK